MSEGAGLLRLMTWLSPAFPVGAFAWSGGLERAVHDGWVKDGAGLQDWAETALAHGALWNDAVLFAAAHRACASDDPHRACASDDAHRACADTEALGAVAELAEALAGSRERHQETLSLGAAFLAAAGAWAVPPIARLAYPVAVGAVCGLNGVALAAALSAFQHAAVSQIVSAGIRLGVAGQAQGVAILARLEPLILMLAEKAAGSTLDDLGSATVRADIAVMRHETQYSRLFRS